MANVTGFKVDNRLLLYLVQMATMSQETEELQKIVQMDFITENMLSTAKLLIKNNADITARIQNRFMIQILREKQNRNAESSNGSDNRRRLIQVLQDRASILLHEHLLKNPDVSTVQELIECGADTYQSEIVGPLGLLGLLLKNRQITIQLDIVKQLIDNDKEKHSGLTSHGKNGETCLFLARGHPGCNDSVVEYLQNTLNSILHQLVKSNSSIAVDQLKDLINSGANLESVDQDNNTILLKAVIQGKVDLVRALVNYGCFTLKKSNNGQTSFDFANQAGNNSHELHDALKPGRIRDELREMIETKQSNLTADDINNFVSQGVILMSPLSGAGSLLNLLIMKNIEVTVINSLFTNFASYMDMFDYRGYRLIELCIIHGSTPYPLFDYFFNEQTATPTMFVNQRLKINLIQFASKNKRTELIPRIQTVMDPFINTHILSKIKENMSNDEIKNIQDTIVECFPDISFMSEYWDNLASKLLVLSLETSCLPLIQFLVKEMKAKYLKKNEYGNDAIAIASQNGQRLIVDYLRQLPEVQLNGRNNNNDTPLHLATKNQHLEVVKLLVKWGANAQLENLHRKTPLDIARSSISDDNNNTKQKIVEFLEQLICPTGFESQPTLRPPSISIDEACELLESVRLENSSHMKTDDEINGDKLSRFFSGTCNQYLWRGINEGKPSDVKKAIEEGAYIGFRYERNFPYNVAMQRLDKAKIRAVSTALTADEKKRSVEEALCYDDIARMILEHTTKKLIQACKQLNEDLFIAYIKAEVPINFEILYYVCSSFDSPEILAHLFQQANIFHSAYNYQETKSPYHIAKEKRHYNAAKYIKYRLTEKCTDAIEENDIELVKQLVRAGASVDSLETNNLATALQSPHKNLELIEFLCDNGAKESMKWGNNSDFILEVDNERNIPPECVPCIKRSLMKRKLRFDAANGDLSSVHQCQRRGVDINSVNCRGSTALLCSIKHGRCFPIVHALVSSGASILHSNPDEKPLIDLAKENGYPEIENYLKEKLDVQFLESVINGDKMLVEEYLAAGANIHFKDKQGSTALHYAVKYHGIDLVKLLCDRGCLQTSADNNGGYPIILATERGNYQLVELLLLRNPGVKNKKDRTGRTALDIAIRKTTHAKIAELLRTGRPVVLFDPNKACDVPKHSLEKLREAAQNGDLNIIKEFVDDVYASRDEKRRICTVLLHDAKSYNQYSVLNLLERYYNHELQTDVRSDDAFRQRVRLSEEIRRVLEGFLAGLGNIIADISIILDPSDPNTYKRFFEELVSKLEKKFEDLKKITNKSDTDSSYIEQCESMNQKLYDIKRTIIEAELKKTETIALIEESTQEYLSKTVTTDIERKKLMEERNLQETNLIQFERTIACCERVQQVLLKRKKVLGLFRDNTNLFLVFGTIEIRLKELFQAILETKQNPGDAMYKRLIPEFSGLAIHLSSEEKQVIKLESNDRMMNKQLDTISTFNEFSVLDQLAADTAGLITLYYKEQIQNIDHEHKIIRKNVYTDEYGWFNNIFFGSKNRNEKESPAIIVADYITAWIIHILKHEKHNLSSDKPLAEQLWYFLAKTDIFSHGQPNSLSKIVTERLNEHLVPLIQTIPGAQSDEERTVLLRIDYLLGCVSVVGLRGDIYQYKLFTESMGQQHLDLETCGYVYAISVTSDEKIVQDIVSGRRMILAHRNEYHSIITEAQQYRQYLRNPASQGQQMTEQDYTKREMANQTARVLCEQNRFLRPENLTAIFRKSGEKLKIHGDVYKEDFDNLYLESKKTLESVINSIESELVEHSEKMRNHDYEWFDESVSNLSTLMSDTKQNLEAAIEKKFDDVETQLMNETQEMLDRIMMIKRNIEESHRYVTHAVEISTACKDSNENSQRLSEEMLQATHAKKAEVQLKIRDLRDNFSKEMQEETESFESTLMQIKTEQNNDLYNQKQAVDEINNNIIATGSEIIDQHNNIGRKFEIQLERLLQMKSFLQGKRHQIQQLKSLCKRAQGETQESIEAHDQADRKVNQIQEKLNQAAQMIDDAEKKY